MFNKENLCEFLVKAKRATYAAGDSAQKFIEKDNSTSLVFEDGEWKYHDNYFGGEPFGGREVVFWNNNPVYIMTYYGWVDTIVNDFSEIYSVLQTALLEIPLSKPFRGPKELMIGNYKYLNNYEGEVDNFFGEEAIIGDGKELYRAKYIGGLVDRTR